MREITRINPTYSTTRTLSLQKPVIKKRVEDKFETFLLLPEGIARQGEGGLRTKGYFKTSLEGKPLITVVTVVFNGDKFLEETILSVINQSYDNIEYIIIDGGSTDSTLGIIKKYQHAIDYWVSEKDVGIYDAMNKGIIVSHGEFIGFVNADDFIYPNTLKILGQAAIEKQFDYTVGPVDLIDMDGQLKEQILVLDDFIEKNRFLLNMATQHQSFYINQRLLKQIGLFNLNYRLRADFDMVIRACLKSQSYFEFKESVGGFREGGVSGSYGTFLENFNLLKTYKVSLVKRIIIISLSLLKIFVIKNFPKALVDWLRKKFSSGRFVKARK